MRSLTLVSGGARFLIRSRLILGKRGFTAMWELKKPSSVNRLWPSTEDRKSKKSLAAAGWGAFSEMPMGWMLSTVGLASADQSTGAPLDLASSIRWARIMAAGNSPAIKRLEVFV